MVKTFHRGNQKSTKPTHKPGPPANTESTPYDIGFAEGKKAGFDEGIKHIVTEVETILCKELGFNSREELAKSGKIPALWIASLVVSHGKDYEERIQRKAEEAKPRRQ